MNTNVVPQSRIKRVAKSKWSWLSTLIIVLVSIYIALQVNSTITKLKYSLTPPVLPEYLQAEIKYLNDSGWGGNSNWFYHASQGTATLPIPYDWLIALEAPKSNPWWTFFGKEDLFIRDNLLQLGFIKQEASRYNPDALPIGLARTPSIYFPGLNRKANAVGFTCAACHTGQIIHNNTRYIVDGGPAMTDLGQLTKSLGAALGQTVLSSQFSILDGRFERFAKRVLGSNYNVLTRNQLKDDLTNTLKYLVKSVDVINVTEGFTRLDALNRIGNQVFDSAMDRPENYAPIGAPVNYPHIWTTSWFDWVQYDGSIMQPLVRNAGEALGVKAFVDTTGPDTQRFASSINYHNLVKMEKWLAGEQPQENQEINGLRAPKWPTDFPAIDSELASEGENLYKDLCQGCHLPAMNTTEFWQDTYWKKIQYVQNNRVKETEDAYLKLNIIPLNRIGTDAAQAEVLPNRTIDTTGLNLNTEVCTPLPDDEGNVALRFVELNDSATSNYGLSLGAFVQRTNLQWFAQNFIPESQISAIEGGRPNCLQVGVGYKARPLNGVWATAPFLHNGSVATVYDLLSTQQERPTFVQLGNQEFDADKLGIVQSKKITTLNQKYGKTYYKVTPDYDDGLFLLDTREPGNHNTGHIFDDEKNNIIGRIGPKLGHEEKMAIIEYLKTL